MPGFHHRTGIHVGDHVAVSRTVVQWSADSRAPATIVFLAADIWPAVSDQPNCRGASDSDDHLPDHVTAMGNRNRSAEGIVNGHVRVDPQQEVNRGYDVTW